VTSWPQLGARITCRLIRGVDNISSEPIAQNPPRDPDRLTFTQFNTTPFILSFLRQYQPFFVLLLF
jgi:hypothetical protein